MRRKILLLLGLVVGMLLNVTNIIAQTCVPPASIASSVRDSFATLTWGNVNGAQSYYVEWRVKNSGAAWRVDSTTTLPYRLNGLTPCTNYEVRVRTKCVGGAGTSVYRTAALRTTGCQAPCNMPNILSFHNVGTTAATLRWVGTGATSYDVEYKMADSNAAIRMVRVNTDSLRLTNLLACRGYVFRVRSVCANGNLTMFSDWSTLRTFSTNCATPPCNAPTLRGVAATNNSATLRWDTLAGQIFELQYKKSSDTIWTTISSSLRSPYTLNNLLTCSPYNFRLRSICNGVRSNWGNVFTFQTSGCVAACIPPRNFRLTAMDTTILAVWDTVPNVLNYLIQYRAAGDTTWQLVNVGRGSNFILRGLVPCSPYEVRIASQCAPNTVSPWAGTLGVNTRGCAVVCPRPMNLSGTLNDSTSVSLTWQGTTTGKYIVEYRGIQDSTGRIFIDSVLGNNYTVRLLPCRGYVFRVKEICLNNVFSDWSNPFVFQTLGCSASGTTCAPPINLTVQADTLIFLSWNGNAPRYAIEVKDSANNVIRRDTVFQNWFIVQGLARCQRYYASVKSLCTPQTSGAVSVSFRTSCANACNLVLSSLPAQLQGCVGSPSVLAVSASGMGNIYQWEMSVNGLVWTDFPNEIRATLYLSNNVAGTMFVRVRVSNPNCPQPIVSNMTRLVVTTCASPCTEIASVTPTIDSTGISLNITPAIMAGSRDSFEVQYRRISDSVWTRRMTQLNIYRLTGLTPCVPYEGRVRRVCPNGVTTWQTGTFTIPSANCQQNCELFNAVFFTDSSNAFRLTTSPQIAATDSIQILWRASVGDTLWRETRVRGGNSTYILPIVGQPCANYQFQVRRLCGNGMSSQLLQRNFVVQGTNCGGNNCNILIGGLPNILNVCQNTPQSLVANVQGTNYTIQWQMSSDSMTWIPLAGANMNIFNVPANNLGTVFMRYVVNSPNCTSPRISNVSRISVSPCICEPIANLQAINDSGRLRVNIAPIIPAGSRDTFEVWYRRVQDSIPMRFFTTMANFILPNTQVCETYEVKVQRRCLNGTSMPQIRTVTLAIPTCGGGGTNCNITIAPLPSLRDVCRGDSIAMINASVIGTNYTVQWQRSTDSINWVDVPNANQAIYFIPTAAVGGSYVRLKVMSTSCPQPIYSNRVLVRVAICGDVCGSVGIIGSQDSLQRGILMLSPATTATLRDTFEVKVRRATDSMFTSFRTTQSVVVVPNVTPCTQYVVEARRICPNGASAWTMGNLYVTGPNCNTNCPEITNAFARDTTIGTMLFAIPNIINTPLDTFEVQYRKVSETIWGMSRWYATAPMLLPRLDTCTDYLIRVRRRCSNGLTTWKEIPFRRGTATCLQGGGVSNQRHVIIANELFTLYPNPTSEVLNLNYQLPEASEVRFDILNLQGQMIRTIQLGTQEKGIYQQSVQDISALQTGFYLMTMRINGKVVATQKWQKF